MLVVKSLARLQLQYQTLLQLSLIPCSRTLWPCRGEPVPEVWLQLHWPLLIGSAFTLNSRPSSSAFLFHRHSSWQWDKLASWKASVPQAISSSSPWYIHLSGQLMSAGAPRPLHRSAGSPGPPFLGQGGGKVAVMQIQSDTKASPVFCERTVKSAAHRCGVKNHSWSKVNVASPRLSSSLSLLAQGEEVGQDTRSFLMDFHRKTWDWPGCRVSRIEKLSVLYILFHFMPWRNSSPKNLKFCLH